MIESIVIYDGECQFCNNLINFVKSKSTKQKISFIALKSSSAIKILKNLKIENEDSVIYIKNNTFCIKSRAVLKICSQLKYPYNQLKYLSFIPDKILNYCYDFIAKRRLNFNTTKKCCNG